MTIWAPSRKSKRGRRMPKGVKAMASKALKLAKDNRRSIEMKQITVTSSADITSSGVVSPITQIAEGNEDFERVGRSIILKSVQIRGYVANNDSIATNPTLVRIMIIRDNSFSGSDPTIANVLQASSTIGLRTQSPEKTHAVSVLYDKLSHVDVNSRNQFTFEKFIKLNSKCIFDGTTSTSSNKGGLYLLLLSNRATNMPTIATQLRVRYVDA